MELKFKDLVEDNESAQDRRAHPRYDSNCPGILELNFSRKNYYIAVTGTIIDLSRSGCLFSSFTLPWNEMDVGKSNASILNTIHATCRIYMPWTNTNCTSSIRHIGSFTVGVEFRDVLPDKLVKQISAQEPNRNLRFEPRCPWKYNRILPRA
jgi:hypothetical protein